MTECQRERKLLVERVVPKPVRKAFRWMNFHLKEDGRTIYRFAKTLPGEQRDEVIERGKDLTTARSKKNLPRGVRNVATSLVVGQCLWYFACPALYRIDAVRESPFGWLASGGLDKLFIASDQHIFETGGYSASWAGEAARLGAGSVAIGAAALAGELATDFSRCYIEYWTQKRYGIVADGAARAYGQVRPFPFRYSSLEAYQKIISYAIRPWTIGTAAQIYSSVYGILGSLWRTGPQLAIVCTVGRAIDRFFKKIAEWTGLAKLAGRIVKDASEREKKAFERIREAVGELKFTALRLQLAAESKTFWKWNPFRPALKEQEADEAARLILEFRGLQASLSPYAPPEDCAESGRRFREGLCECAARLESVLGRKRLAGMAPSFARFTALSENEGPGEIGSLIGLNESFGNAVEELLSERELS